MTDSPSPSFSRRALLIGAITGLGLPALRAGNAVPTETQATGLANAWAMQMKEAEESSSYPLIVKMFEDPKLARKLDQVIDGLPQELRCFIDADRRPVAHHKLILRIAHKHLIDGQPLDRLPPDFQEYLTLFARTLGKNYDPAQLPIRNDPSKPAYRYMGESYCDTVSSYLLFVSDGTVVALSTNPKLKAAAGADNPKARKKHLPSDADFNVYEAGMLHQGNHLLPGLYDAAKERFFACGAVKVVPAQSR